MPEAGQGRVDARVHLRAWDSEVLQAEGEFLPNGQFRRRQLVRRRREDDPDSSKEVRGHSGGRVDAGDRHAPFEPRANDTRYEARGGEGEGRLACASPPGNAHDRTRRYLNGYAVERGLAPTRVADRKILDREQVGRRRRRVRRAGRRHRSAPVSARTTTATIASISPRRMNRSTVGSLTTR